MKRKQGYLLYCFLFVSLTAFLLFSFRQLLVTLSHTWADLHMAAFITGLLVYAIFFITQRMQKQEQPATATGIVVLANVLGFLCLLLSALSLAIWGLFWLLGTAPNLH